jgi:hypothetical protein
MPLHGWEFLIIVIIIALIFGVVGIGKVVGSSKKRETGTSRAQTAYGESGATNYKKQVERVSSFCPKCGKQVSGEANFCRECGFNLRAEETDVQKVKPSATLAKTTQEPQRATTLQPVKPQPSQDVQQSGESKQQWQSRIQDTPPPTGVEHYRRLWKQFAWAWLGCWILAIPIAIFIPYFGIPVAVFGGACYILFCYYYCKSKRQSGAWTLCAVFLGLIGLLILAFLPDRNNAG